MLVALLTVYCVQRIMCTVQCSVSIAHCSVFSEQCSVLRVVALATKGTLDVLWQLAKWVCSEGDFHSTLSPAHYTTLQTESHYTRLNTLHQTALCATLHPTADCPKLHHTAQHCTQQPTANCNTLNTLTIVQHCTVGRVISY